LNWTAGSNTTSHDIYFGEDEASLPLLSEGQTGTTFDPPGSMDYATTYYWRIDEVGPGGTTTGTTVWSFTTLPSPPPGQATNPNPTDGAVEVDVNDILSWTAGTGAVSHDVYFGTDSGALPLVSPQQPMMLTYYNPGTMEQGITYYWRIDEYNIDYVKTEGARWSFTTVLPVPPDMATPTNPINLDGTAVDVCDVGISVILTWLSGDRAASHDVYFGTSYDQVFNADNTSPEFKGNILQEEGEYIPDVGTYFTWNPTPDGNLPYESSYWWRIDEINPGGVTEGAVWNFTTESDTEAPKFMYPPDAVSITAQEATIIWTTNELSDSNVGYGLDTSYGSKVYDGTLVKVHNVTLTGLQPGTTYYYKATSTDSAGNSASEVGFEPFTTETLPPELPWSDDFESGDFAAGGWTVVATPASVDESGAYTGSYGAHLKKTGTIEKPISTAGYQAIHVKYARTTKNMKSTEFLFVDWYDGSGWHELETTNDTSWGTVEILCGGAGADNNPNFKVRFRVNGKNARVEAMIDDVEIFGTPSGPDTNPPTPDPMTWAVEPHATGSASISMTATTASDVSGVRYYFACITDEAHDSGWQDSPTYEDTELTTGLEYTYQVQAQDKSTNQNETGWSTEASATPVDLPPAPPTGLVATPGDSQVSLDWNNNTEQDIDGYNVYRSETPGSYGAPLLFVTDSAYVDNDVVNGTTYYYVVTAVDQALNESDNSNEASATPSSQQAVYVESISMDLVSAGINWKGTADVQISVHQANATVFGDWYLGSTGTTADTLLESGATGLTDAGGLAAFISVPDKAKSGEYFTFVVTDVILAGYVFDPDQGVTENSIIVP
jgi:hypothetical protein